MIIRKATKKDISTILELCKELQKDVIKGIPKNLRGFDTILPKKMLMERINDKNALSLVVEENGVVVGYNLNKIEITFGDTSDIKQGKISEIYISKKFRGKSISTLLYQEALKWFKDNGCEYIQLNVYENNPAKDIYIKWGFKPFSLNMKKQI